MTGIKTIYKSPSTVKIIWSWGYSSVGSAYLAPQVQSQPRLHKTCLKPKKKKKQQHNRVKELGLVIKSSCCSSKDQSLAPSTYTGKLIIPKPNEIRCHHMASVNAHIYTCRKTHMNKKQTFRKKAKQKSLDIKRLYN